MSNIAHIGPQLVSAARLSLKGRLISLQSRTALSAAKTNRASKGTKVRLDELCIQQYPEVQPNVLRSWIAQGKVLVGNKPVNKAGTQVSVTADVQLNATEKPFVCRSGVKLEEALREFAIDVRGKRALDCGISTGGFTDCLLQHGAASVVGVDVGYGQVAEKVRQDPKVLVLEKTNLRHLQLTQLPKGLPVDIVTLDLSFISILTVLPQVKTLLAEDGQLVTLIKPQFEALKHQVQEGGVVTDPDVHEEVIARVRAGAGELGFECQGVIESPIKGAASGNKEFLAHFIQN